MKRPARLESAKNWIPTYTGKHLLRGYCNYFAVNWRCAAIELNLLGIRIDPAYIAMRERTDADLMKRRMAKKDERVSLQDSHWHPFTDAHSAYLSGDFAALHDLEMRSQYGDEWESYVIIEHSFCDDAFDDSYECDVEASEYPRIFDPSLEQDWIPF